MIFIQAVLVLMIERNSFMFGQTVTMMNLGSESHAGVFIIIEPQTGATSYCGQRSLLKAIVLQVLCHNYCNYTAFGRFWFMLFVIYATVA